MNHQFRRYNSSLKEITTEEETLEHIKDSFYRRPNKEEKQAFKSPDSWAKYAFNNQGVYFATFYENDKPLNCVKHDDHSLSIKFLNSDESGSVNFFLELSFLRFHLDKLFDDVYQPYLDNKIFFSNITAFTKNADGHSRHAVTFNLQNESVKRTEFIFKDGDSNYQKIESSSKVDLSNNFFKGPEHYLDFEHLFDFREILNIEDIELPEAVRLFRFVSELSICL